MRLSLTSLSDWDHLAASLWVGALTTRVWEEVKKKMTPLWFQPVTATLSPTSAPGEGITGMTKGNPVLKQLQDELVWKDNGD